MAGQLSLDIGGLAATLEWGPDLGEIRVPEAYRPFVVPGAGGMPIRLNTAGPRPEPGLAAFDNTPIWALHRSPGGRRFEIFPEYPTLRRTLVVDDALRQAQLTFRASDCDPFTGPALELITILRLAQRRGLILHGCGVERNGRGTAFVGVSGAGKSTLSRLWAAVDGVRILSDDRLIVRTEADGLRLYGSPWHGDAQFAAAGGVPLDRIFFIRHGTGNERTPLRPALVVRELMCCSFPPYWDPDGMRAGLESMVELSALPCEVLDFVPDPTVIDFLLEAA